MQGLDWKGKWLVTYAVLIVIVVLLKPLEGVTVHCRNMQGPRVVGLTESWIQLCVHSELRGAGQDLKLEVREAQIVGGRQGLDIAGEHVWTELHCHFDEGHGECNPMLRLLGRHNSRSSPKLDAAESVLLTREQVPRSVLVWTNVIDDLISGSIVDVVKGHLVSMPCAVRTQWEGNGNRRAQVALAEAENSVLP